MLEAVPAGITWTDDPSPPSSRSIDVRGSCERDGQRGRDYGAGARRAVHAQLAVRRGGAVAQPEQPGAGVVAGAADAVVADLDAQRVAVDRGGDPGAVGVRVLDGVRQRLGDDEVGGRLERR